MNSHDPHNDLEAELTALGDLIDVPAPPPADVAAAVRARLTPADSTDSTGSTDSTDSTDTDDNPAASTATPARQHPEDPAGADAPLRGSSRAPGRRVDGRRPSARRGRRKRWTIVAAVVAAVIAVTAATPQGREAVARILRFAGVELRISETPAPAVTATAPLPGERTVPPSELPRTFQVRTPSALGEPERVTEADGGRVVSMFWPDGIRLDQFDGGLDPIFFKKLTPLPAYTEVSGRTAWWIPGEHPLGYLSRADGTEIPLRQAAPTLIWQDGTLDYRLEGVRTMAQAVRIAESLR
ncbi:hypothetical protein ACIBP6_38280 [Nonomuraea terrae]|uniref:hypothetical protein n=1 Tax=Nonomuraea terrae TaxID=2530383 RepID=UPI0037AC6178